MKLRAFGGLLCRFSSSGGKYHPDTMTILRNKDKEVFLVGTAHVSKVSAQQVRDVIAAVHPDSVVLELCDERAQRLRSGSAGGVGAFSMPDFSSASKLLGSLIPAGGVFEILLKAIYKIFQGLGNKPGGEFVAAIEECKKRGILTVNGDQEAKMTMTKLSSAFSLARIMSLMASQPPDLSPEQRELFDTNMTSEELVERIKTRAFVESSTRTMRKVAPDLIRILLDERDEILTDSIIRAPGKRIVAIVGMAHMEGIEKQWNERT
jgi:pheromone shutdown protein TraB